MEIGSSCQCWLFVCSRSSFKMECCASQTTVVTTDDVMLIAVHTLSHDFFLDFLDFLDGGPLD